MDTIGIELLINANILGNILVVDSHDMKMIYIYIEIEIEIGW